MTLRARPLTATRSAPAPSDEPLTDRGQPEAERGSGAATFGAPPSLQLEAVTVRFGGLVASNAVDLRVDRGTIDGLVGPNGAGKTTLFNVISGAQAPTAGTVRVDGRDITRLDRGARARLGVSRTFQNLSLVAGLTALDNVVVGLARFRRSGLPGSVLRLPHAVAEDRRLRDRARGALAFVELDHAAHEQVQNLPYGDRRRVELARALALAPRLLLLDEPSAGMDPSETEQLAGYIDAARADLGVTVLVVEHDMSFVRLLCRNVTVLDFGQVIAAGPTDVVLTDPRVLEAYLGTTDGAGA